MRVHGDLGGLLGVELLHMPGVGPLSFQLPIRYGQSDPPLSEPLLPTPGRGEHEHGPVVRGPDASEIGREIFLNTGAQRRVQLVGSRWWWSWGMGAERTGQERIPGSRYR